MQKNVGDQTSTHSKLKAAGLCWICICFGNGPKNFVRFWKFSSFSQTSKSAASWHFSFKINIPSKPLSQSKRSHERNYSSYSEFQEGQKMQTSLGRKGSLDTSHPASYTRLGYLQWQVRLIRALFSPVLKAPKERNCTASLGIVLHCFTILMANYFSFVCSQNFLYCNFLQLPLLCTAEKSMAPSPW